jgi:eukaryotic-like serine/threonine-protein kinase
MEDLVQLPALLGESAAPVPLHERRFGRFTLLCRIASGGMASLYLARFVGPDGFEKHVAIKRIHPHLTENEEFVRMFIDEARLAARINHPNVAQVLELGTVDGSYFIAMEYVDGETLTAILKQTKPDYAVAARIVSNAAAGLHAAHELRGSDGHPLQVVHRDVSPANILVSYQGAVKVVDFGVARARGAVHSTQVGSLKGKAAYMAPEQARGAQVDRRADVFALGIVLYESTTWRRLFRAETESDTLAKVLQGDIPRPSSMVGDFPPALEKIIIRALAPEPERRYPTAHQMELDLEQYIVSTGRPVVQATIADLMATVFPDRIEKRKLMLRDHQPSFEIPSLEHADTPSSLSLGNVSPPVATPSRRRGLWIVIVGLLLVAAAGVGVALALMNQSTSRSGGLVNISVRVTPPAAKVLLDGKPVQNPLQLRQAASSGLALAELSAPGYVPQRLSVPLDQSGNYVIALQRAAPDAGRVDARVAAARPDGSAVPGGTGKTPIKGGKKTIRKGKPEKKSEKPEPKPENKSLFPNPYGN